MKFIAFCILVLLCSSVHAQKGASVPDSLDGKTVPVPGGKVFYGTASYYADKFNGRPTANGEMYSSTKMTAACNVLPLGTWIRVTNLTNNRSVVVRTNDRLHIRMKRLVDLSHVAAEKLGYLGRGLTKVRVEVLEKR